jgi:hypothetical protein
MNGNDMEGSGLGINRGTIQISVWKPTKKLSQDTRSPGQNLKPGPHKYEASATHSTATLINA